MGLPRLFLVEGEYAVAMKRAEGDWIRQLIEDIDGDRLWITKERMEAIGQTFENRTGGGEEG
jgi:hypothetical protein